MGDDLDPSLVLRVALVIPVHNRKETTLQCLRSLDRIDKTSLEIRTIVVDDGSTDGTPDAIRKQFPEVELVCGDGTLHYAAGTNRGIKAALNGDPDFIVTMNDDSIFHDQFLQNLVSTSRKNEHSVVGGLLLLWNAPHRVFQVDPKWKTLSGGWVFPDRLTAFDVASEAFEVECIVGNCVCFPLAAIEENGLMDEQRFPHGWGDAQYTTRMRQKGWRLLIDPRALIWCEPNSYPAPLHTLPVRAALKALLFDQRQPSNLHRQMTARLESAPSKAKAVLAFGVYFLSLIGKGLKFGILSKRRPAPSRDEDPCD